MKTEKHSQHRPTLRKGRLLSILGVIVSITAISVSFSIVHALETPPRAFHKVQAVSKIPAAPQPKPLPTRYNGQTQKTVYLTFDDGPSAYEGQILDILKSHNIHATFFLVGRNIPSHTDVLQRLVKEGNYPGLHSMTHIYTKLYTEKQIVPEMQQVQELIRNVTGVTSHLTRCPYGSKPGLTPDLRDQMVAAGFKEWDWTVDSLDWKMEKHPEQIAKNVLSHTTRDQEVVIMHEKPQTVQALPAIIDGLVQQGYEFGTYHESDHVSVNFWHDNRL